MMITICLSILKFIVLSIGLTSGYWLLTTACKEEGWKKILGKVFGWILIIYSIIITAMLAFQWINFMQKDRYYPQRGCPVHQMMREKMKDEMDKEFRKNPTEEKQNQEEPD